MLQPRIATREVTLTSLANTLNNLALCSRHAPKARSPQLIFTRHASHAAQGRANGPKDSAGRRLGAKKTASEYVIPGNIIFKQRGTKWFPGENVGIGKDHTIYSLIHGYVRYYRNPSAHPKRRYIGVALEREGPASKMPTPFNAPTRRRLGMYATPRVEPTSTPAVLDQAAKDSAFLRAHIAGALQPGGTSVPTPPQAVTQSQSQKNKLFTLNTAPTNPFDPKYDLRRGGYGMANYEIGRAAERKGVQVTEFDRTDRWKAWRVRAKKVKEKMMARAARANRKTKGRKSSKKVA
ncbi:54S ribosomal protein L2 mitochondrial [Knufia obscura]|uniref:Large ribosomal subunit protein bL27m n=1 Tax=Knufia obscura TaxID=1635080 RepID=A0ABR0RK42_9EURO|nr:54S ribosomal protein L2 mitochondrial [Knufia obscura]